MLDLNRYSALSVNAQLALPPHRPAAEGYSVPSCVEEYDRGEDIASAPVQKESCGCIARGIRCEPQAYGFGPVGYDWKIAVVK